MLKTEQIDLLNVKNRRSLNRPITGIIQNDRIWEQWYSEDIMNKDFPKMNQRDYLFKCNEGYEDSVIINNRGKKKYAVKQFEALVDWFTNILYYGYNLKKGDIVCTIALSTPELVAIKYACATIGAITCNLNFLDSDHISDGKNVLLEEITALRPKMLFTLDILEDKVSDIVNSSECKDILKIRLPLARSTPFFNVERLAVSLLLLKNKIGKKSIIGSIPFRKFSKHYEPRAKKVESVYEPNLPCNIAFTSGTTGQNKAVLISHDANNALTFQHKLADLGLKRHAKHLALVPPFLAFWDSDIIHMSLCMGVENILELNLSYENIPKYMTKYLPQYGIWSQYLWDSILHLPPKDLAKVSKALEKAVVGGERCEKNQAISFYNLTGIIQEAGYGATEVDTCFSFAHPNCNIVGSAGIPLPYNNVKIVDSDFNDLTYNQPGRLLISSPCLMLGYYGRNDLTKQALHTDENGVTWYDTKDYAYVDENGCLFVLDRYNPPAEIIVDNHKEEANLLDIVERIKADRYIKICKLMEYNGHLILHLVIDEFLNISETDAIESIISTIKSALPEKYYPDIIHILKSLPRTSVGKVDYPKLKKDTESIYRKNNNIVGKLNVVID